MKTENTIEQKETKGTKRGELSTLNSQLSTLNLPNPVLDNQRTYVPLDAIVPDPDQPRKEFAPGPLKELADSIKSVGIWEDLTVQPLCKGKYKLIDGERRWRAAKLAGLDQVPVSVRTVTNPRLVQLIANQQRENLTALEEAAAYRTEIDGGVKPEDLAQRLGLSRTVLFKRLALNKADKETRKALEKGQITPTVAELCMMVPSEKREEYIDEVAGNDFGDAPASSRAAAHRLEYYVRKLKQAPFDQNFNYGQPLDKDGKPLIVSAACASCPRRSGNMTDPKNGGLSSADICTQPECFDAKVKAYSERVLAQAKEQKRPVLSYDAAFDKRHQLKNEYVDLNDKCEPLGWENNEHWRAALGNASPTVSVVLDEGGQAHELVDRKLAMAALKTKYPKLKTGSNNGNASTDAATKRWHAQQAAQRKKQQEKNQEQAAIHAAIVAKVEDLKEFGPSWLWDVMGQAALNMAGYYRVDPIAKRRQWAKEAGYYGHTYAKQFAKMTLAQRVGLAIEIACGERQDAQNRVAKELKLDTKQIVAVVREERGSKSKSKSKSKKQEGKPRKNAKDTKKV